MKIPLHMCCPSLSKFFDVMGLSHVLEIRSCVHVALMFDFMISVIYGIMWVSDILQLTCLTCLSYQPVGVVIFFMNAWVAGMLLANFDETGELAQKHEAHHAELLRDVESRTVQASSQADAMCGMLTKGLMKHINLLVEDMQTILVSVRKHCVDESLYGAIRDSMVDMLFALRQFAIEHFAFDKLDASADPVPVRTRRDMRLYLDGLVGNEAKVAQKWSSYNLRNLRDVLDVRESFLRSKESSVAPLSCDTSPAEFILWPKDTMVNMLSACSQLLKEQSKRKAQRTDQPVNAQGRLLDSPLCVYLVIGLVFGVCMLIFYAYTLFVLLREMMGDDCNTMCWFDDLDGVIRKGIGVLATACHVTATLLIITKIDKLDHVMQMKKEIVELEGINSTVNHLNTKLSTGIDTSIDFAEVNAEVFKGKAKTEAFIKKLAARPNATLPQHDYKDLLQTLRTKAAEDNVINTSGNSDEKAPLIGGNKSKSEEGTAWYPTLLQSFGVAESRKQTKPEPPV